MTDHFSDCKWEKFGYIQGKDYLIPDWATSHFLVPTPHLIENGLLRAYGSFLDRDFVGRIGWIDLDLTQEIPKILNVSATPFLDVGPKGSFSEFGTGMGFVTKLNQDDFIGYVGFSRPRNFKFKAFSGVLPIENISKVGRNQKLLPDYGTEFGGETIVGFHDVLEISDGIVGVFSVGNDFQYIDGKPFPKYRVHIAKGESLYALKTFQVNVTQELDSYYRVGRPRIFKTKYGYELLVTAGNIQGEYKPFIFYSNDLKSWEIGDISNFTNVVIAGFDDLHQCYLSRFDYMDRAYLIYNGNFMGKNGFGIARQK